MSLEYNCSTMENMLLFRSSLSKLILIGVLLCSSTNVSLSELTRSSLEYSLFITITGLGEDDRELLLLDTEGSLEKNFKYPFT